MLGYAAGKNAFRGFFLLKPALKTNINFLPDVLWGQISKNSASFFHWLHPWHICWWRCCLYSFSSLQGEDNTFVFRRFVQYSRLLLSSEGGEKKASCLSFSQPNAADRSFSSCSADSACKKTGFLSHMSPISPLFLSDLYCIRNAAFNLYTITFRKKIVLLQSNNVTKIKWSERGVWRIVLSNEKMKEKL